MEQEENNISWADRAQIGVVLDFPSPALVQGARDYCDQHGLFLDARWSVRGDWLPKSVSWDAVMVRVNSDSRGSQALLRRMRKTKMKRVWLMGGEEGPEVSLDYRDVGFRAAAELGESSHRSLLMLRSDYPADQHTTEGARTFAEANGMEFTDCLDSSHDFDAVKRKFFESITKAPKPVGVICLHAAVGFSLQKDLIQNGLMPGEEVGMVVLDKDLQETAAMAPVPMSAVNPNSWHHGFVAAEQAHRLIQSGHLEEEKLLIPARGIDKRETTGGVSERDMLTGRALNYVRTHYREPIDVNDVVAAVGGSRRLIELRFRALMNRGVHEEIARLRCDEAKRLLVEDPAMKIAEVAREAGFSSIYYFSAAFKKEIGESPRAYRKRELAGEEGVR